MLTAYQLIDRRFGHTLHKVTAGLFLLTRAAAEGVRVFAISIVVGIAIGTGDITLHRHHLRCSPSSTPSKAAWPPSSGPTSSRWASTSLGTLVALYTLGANTSPAAGHYDPRGRRASRPSFTGSTSPSPSPGPTPSGPAFLGGTFLTMASHGTDQLMVQRMLAARNLRESRLALLRLRPRHLPPVHPLPAHRRRPLRLLRRWRQTGCPGSRF